MGKGLISLMLALLCFSSRGQSSNIFNAMSPGLRQFLVGHPAAAAVLSNVIASDFATKPARLNYFSSTDPYASRGSYYLTNGLTVILIGQSQWPADEFIALYFEVKNSENAPQLQGIFTNVQAGNITREIYGYQMLQLEFYACKATRDMLAGLADDPDISAAPLYKTHSGCPDTFDDFLAYLDTLYAGHPGPLENFEKQFDEMQGRRGGI